MSAAQILFDLVSALAAIGLLAIILFGSQLLGRRSGSIDSSKE